MDDDIPGPAESAENIAMNEPAGSGAAPAWQLHLKQIEYLQSQMALHTLQAEKLRAEVHHLHAERATAAVQAARERLKLVLDVGLAMVGLALMALVGMLLYGSASSRSVVVEPFSVPPQLEAQGETGVVLASGFLDRLQALQNATRSSAQHRNVEDAWSNDIKVDIPETGVSIGEVLKYLRTWLGDDIHIGGNVVRTNNMILFSVRGSGIPAKSFIGKVEDLPSLTAKAAEYVYGQAEPYLFGAYLENEGRDREAIDLVTALYGTVKPSERAELLTIWGNALLDTGDIGGAIDKYREEISLDARSWIAYTNLINAQIILGREEAALQTAAAMESATQRGSLFETRLPEIDYQNQNYLRMNLLRFHRALQADMQANRGLGTSSVQDAPLDAELLARLHENRSAELELETSPESGTDPYVIAESAFVRGLVAINEGRFISARDFIATTDRLFVHSKLVASDFYTPPACLAGWLAEWTGQHEIADSDIKRGGHFEDCYRFKGDIADHRGQWPEAKNDYAAAVALAPSMPQGYFSWAEGLMRHRDYRGAAIMFAASHARGPAWADPLKGWGDALAAQGDFPTAVAKYEEAAQDAPHWGGVHLAWGRALDRLGRHDEAVAQYRAALAMDLTGDEHWTLRNCCG